MDAELDLGKLTSDIKKLDQFLRTLDPTLKRTEGGLRQVETASKTAGTAAAGLGAGFRSLIPQLTAAHLATTAIMRSLQGLKTAFTAPMAHARSFETVMARVSTVMEGDSTDAVRTLSKEILELSKVIPKTKEELGTGLYQIMQSGIEDAADAMTVLKVASEASVGGVTEVDTAAKLLTDTINAYGLSAQDAQELADVMFVGAKMGTAEFADLATSLGNVNATASLVGVSVNEVVAAMEAMSLAGISPDEAATALNRLLTETIEAAGGMSDAAKLSKELGFEFSSTALRTKGLQQFMDDLSEAVGDNEVAMRTLAGEQRAFKAVAVIAGEGAENFRKILEATKDSEGALREAFIKNADTVDNLLVVAWNGLTATMTEAAQEHLPEMKEKIQDLIDTLEENQDAIFNTASAFTDSLITAFQTVIENAPAIIEALGKVASAASLAAQGINMYLNKTAMFGETIAQGGFELRGSLLGDRESEQYAREISKAHEKGLLFRDVQAQQIQQNKANSQAQQELFLQNMGRQGELQKLENKGVRTPQEENMLQQLRSGMSPEDILAAEMKAQKQREKDQKKQPETPDKPGGGGAKSDKEREKILKEIEKIEADILKSYGEQAKANRDRMEDYRDELKLRKDIGVITADELKMLDRLNNRVEFQEDKIKDATEAWKEQVDALEKVDEKISDINDKIIEEHRELQKTLADIDRDAARRKEEIRKDSARSVEEKAADMVRELKDLDDKLARGEGNSEAEQQKRREIEAALQTISPEQRAAGQNIASLNPFEEIARQESQKLSDAEEEARRRKIEAAEESNARTEALVNEMVQAESNRTQIVALERDKSQAVISALEQRALATEATYKKIETDTAAHVTSQIEEFNRLQNSLRTSAPVQSTPGFAGGGAVTGAGTATSDSILARLSDGEHVFDAADVRAMGGQAAVLQFRDALHASRTLPRFAEGGAVSSTVDNSRSANITVNNHGRAAEVYANPRRARWDSRFYF